MKTETIRMSNPAKALKPYKRIGVRFRSVSHSENPKSGLETPPYTSDTPFELVPFDVLIPPTYDIENEAYARDIAASMLQSGWTGRPLWGMEESGEDVYLRTGSHRYFALETLLGRNQWPANLPFGYVPVYVMREPDVSPRVWDAWEEADWWEMKDLGDRGVGPDPVVKLMRAERNPRPKQGKLERAGKLAKEAAAWPITAAVKAGEIAVNPELHAPTPVSIYELWDTTIGAGQRISVHLDRRDFNAAKRDYWKRKPLAKLEMREVRSDRARSATAGNPSLKDKRVAFTSDKHGKPVAYLVSMSQMRNLRIGYDQAKLMVATGQAVEVPYRTFGTEHNPTDRAYRYRANATPPKGPKRCLFCGSREQIMVGHLDGHEENTDPRNLIWNCRSCNGKLGHAYKKLGIGRRTRQYNPREYDGKGAKNLAQWVLAVGVAGTHGGKHYPSNVDSDMTQAEARQMIDDTPRYRQVEFNREIWKRRVRFGTDKTSEVPF